MILLYAVGILVAHLFGRPRMAPADPDAP